MSLCKRGEIWWYDFQLNGVRIRESSGLTQKSAAAQAEAIRIQAQAINSQGGADYVALQKIKTWDGHACTSYCGLEAMFITPGK